MTIESWLCRTLAAGRPGGPLPAEPDAIVETATRHRVDILLADLLHSLESSATRDDPASSWRKLPWASGIVMAAVAREMVIAREVPALFDAARQAALDVLLLKGTALAYTHYPKPYLRPRQDVDLYIRFADLARAEGVLASLGYRRATEADAELWTGQRHYTKTTASGDVHVDLHWRIANPLAFADALPFDEVWSRSVVVSALGPAVRTLSARDTLAVACVHRVAHHQDRVNLLWLWDIHLVASSLPDDAWSAFVTSARAWRIQSVCARSLRLAVQHFATAIPEAALREVSGGDEPASAFLREGLRQVDIARADLEALDGWRRRMSLVREHLCPPVSYMRARYANCPPVLLPLAYVYRIVRGAPRWFTR